MHVPRYILYARKSTESEDRQVLSIDSQIAELHDIAREQKLHIVAVHKESRSAKAPGREVFGQILAAVGKGEVDGIISWKIDRLARNPVDGGALIWAFDQGKLKEIVTPGRTFKNTGNDKFWMQLEFGIAKKYIDDLSDNVRRGNRAKLTIGWRPGPAPVGYMNDPATRTIIPDPERFPLIRRVWEQILAGRSPAELLLTLNTIWGFRTLKRRRSGNRPIGHTSFYSILENPFYYGLIISKGEAYAGAHKPMITKDEFDRAQTLLGRPSRNHVKKYLFAFTGLIRCGECGAMVTAEEQVNRQGHHYIYYHCTKRLKTVSCSQQALRAERLEEQIQGILRTIQIDDEFRDWALTHVGDVQEREAGERQAIARSVAETRKEVEQRASSLLDLRLRGFISDEEYALKKRDLAGDLLRLNEREAREGPGVPSWFEPLQQAILFVNLAPKRFAIEKPENQRAIVGTLGSNLFLKDRILRIKLQKPFEVLSEGRHNPVWWSRGDGIRTLIQFFREHPTLIQWPSFCREAADAFKESSPRGPV